MDLDQFFSCETQLVITLQDLCKNCDSGKQTGVAILDFSKAFDKVAPNRLLHELDSYGTTENLHLWLQTFLTKRYMKGHRGSSRVKNLRKYLGTQASHRALLGPVPFLCHINDLPETVKSQLRLFADDCFLYRTINSQQDHHILQSDLKKLEQ